MVMVSATDVAVVRVVIRRMIAKSRVCVVAVLVTWPSVVTIIGGATRLFGLSWWLWL